MQYDKRQIAQKLVRWERFMNEFRLPGWEELPKIDLYMDQVIGLITQYLGFFVFDPNEEKLLTPSMVNNYVKMKLLPAPQKKKYGRKHIALLIMICTFKQSLSMAAVEQMLPPDDDEPQSARTMSALSPATSDSRCTLSSRCGASPTRSTTSPSIPAPRSTTSSWAPLSLPALRACSRARSSRSNCRMNPPPPNRNRTVQQ